MRKLGFFLGAAAVAMLGAGAAQAHNFDVSILYWLNDGAPPADPDPAQIAHFQVDDSLMSATSDSARATIDGTGFNGYEGQLTVDFFEADVGGGFDLIPWADGAPDWNNMYSGGATVITDAYVMYSGTNDAPHLTPGVFDMPGYQMPGNFRVTISDAQDGVPEPATWAMMLGGFGLIGGTLRRRRIAFA